MKKKRYNVRWSGPTLAALANIDIMARNDREVIASADIQGRKFGYTHCGRTIYRDNRLIHQQ